MITLEKVIYHGLFVFAGMCVGAMLVLLIPTSSTMALTQNEAQEESLIEKPILCQTSTESLTGEKLEAIATYYSADLNQTDGSPCISADGTNICHTKENIIAANWLPFNTKVKIKDKIYRVADRMNQRYQKPHIDILVKSSFDARNAGRQKVKIEILK